MTGLNDTDTAHLRRAIALAHQARELGSRPFGAIAIDIAGTLIAESRNSTQISGNPTEHAEIVAINAAWAAGNVDALRGATVYASGEPCPMCAAALVLAGVTRIVFAAAATDISAVLGEEPMFDITCAALIATTPVPIVVSGPHFGDHALQPFRDSIA